MEKKNWPVDPERIAKGLYWQEAWKLVEGCTHVSAGCDNCWSASETHIRARQTNLKISGPKKGLTLGSRFNGVVRLRHDNLEKPLNRKKPTVYAVWNDLFHEDVPLEFLTQAMTVIDRCRNIGHIFLVLTKRPERMHSYINGVCDMTGAVPPENLWLGTSVEDQKTADERIPLLLQTPAAKRFVSYEPAIGPVDFEKISPVPNDWRLDVLRGLSFVDGRNEPANIPKLDLIIMGGESGPGARPMHPDWARSVRDQCKASGVAFVFKQWGEWAPLENSGAKEPTPIVFWRDEKWYPGLTTEQTTHMVRVGKTRAGCLLDGIEHKELPINFK